jgi:hypothetical protein
MTELGGLRLTTAERSTVTNLDHAIVSPDQRYLILCRAEEIWIVPLEG